MPAGSLKQDPPCQGKRAGIQSHQPLGFLILMGPTKCSRPKGPRETRTDGLPAPGLQPTLALSWAVAVLAAGTVGAVGAEGVSGHLPFLCSCLSATCPSLVPRSPGLFPALLVPSSFPGHVPVGRALRNVCVSYPVCVGETRVGFGEVEAERDLGPQHGFLFFPLLYTGLPCWGQETSCVSHPS